MKTSVIAIQPRSVGLAALAIVAACAVPASVEAQPSNGRIISAEPYALPPYDSTIIARGHHYSEAEYAEVRQATDFELHRIVYESDGLPVVAHLYQPTNHAGGRALPVIVFLRGGYVVEDQAAVLAPTYRELAERGFIVLAPQLRGSAGAPGHDEMGGADVADVLNLAEVVEHLPQADAGNVFLLGESRGGIMAYRAVQEGMRVKAAATYGAITDLERYLDALEEQRPGMAQAIVETVWPDYDRRRETILTTRSALAWPGALDVPLLIMHGGADADVSPTHALDLARQLTEVGRTYELVIFAGDQHTLPNHENERNRRATDWFSAHLGPPQDHSAP